MLLAKQRTKQMTFSEAVKACNAGTVVYYNNVPHLIEYTTAGGSVRPEEGIADIMPTNPAVMTAPTRVDVPDLSLTAE